MSRQFSDGRCMAEALGGSGWGLSPADLENYVDWLAESGIDTIAFHLWQYQADSASVRDWPPNIPRGLSWKDAASAVFDKLNRKWDNRLRKPRPVLLVAPERGVQSQFDPADAMALNEHNGSGTPDSRSGKISRAFPGSRSIAMNRGFLLMLQVNGYWRNMDMWRMVFCG